MQNLDNQLPDAFTDLKRVTKSHIPAANAPMKLMSLLDKLKLQMSMRHAWSVINPSVPKFKKNSKNPRKRKEAKK